MERLWHYYAKSRDEHGGPVSEQILQEMLARNALLPDDLVWSEGLTDWTPVSAALSTGAAARVAQAPPSIPRSMTPGGASSDVAPPPNLKSWLRFVGVMSILAGTLYCFSCVGILWGVLLIVGGIALLGARSTLDTIPTVPPAFVPFLDKLNTFFLVTGIAYIIMIIGTLLFTIFYGSLLIAMLSNMPL